jgi:hypothetical protein
MAVVKADMRALPSAGWFIVLSSVVAALMAGYTAIGQRQGVMDSSDYFTSSARCQNGEKGK